MFKQFTAISIFAFFLFFPLRADAAGFYWGAQAAYSKFEFDSIDIKLKNISGYDPQTLSFGVREKSNALGARFVYGVDFNWAGSIPLRIENEVSISQGGSVKKDAYFDTTGMLLGVIAHVELDIEPVVTDTLNFWLDVPVGSFPIKPYLGFGLGYYFMHGDADIILNKGMGPAETKRSRNFNISEFYYHLSAGARFRAGKRSFVDFNLRYQKEQDYSVKVTPFELGFALRQFSIGLGWSYYF